MTTARTEPERVAAWRDLCRRHAHVSLALERELHERHGIGATEFDALERLAEWDERKCRAQDLTEGLPLSQSAASRLVSRLERRGLVERAMCDLDRRGIFVCLTDGGRRLYHEARPTHRAVLARTLTD